MHLSNSYFRCNKSYKTCPVKGTITISFLFEKELFLKFVTLKTEITPCLLPGTLGLAIYLNHTHYQGSLAIPNYALG